MFNIKIKVERTHVLQVTSYNTSTSYKLTSDNTRTSYEWQHKNKFPVTTEDKLRVTKKGQVTSDNTKEVLGWQHGYVQTVQHMLESRNQYLQLMIPLPLRAYTNKVLLLNFNKKKTTEKGNISTYLQIVNTLGIMYTLSQCFGSA